MGFFNDRLNSQRVDHYDNYLGAATREMLNANRSFCNLKKVVVSDCDGILTDGTSTYSKDGKMLKTYGSYDKEAMQLLVSIGWRFIFVSEDRSGFQITKSRIEDLQMKFGSDLVQLYNCDAKDRFGLVKQLVEDGTFTLFAGDSLSDIPTLDMCSFPTTTRNAPAIVQIHCKYVSDLDGGHGGFADILLSVNDYLIRQNVDDVQKMI